MLRKLTEREHIIKRPAMYIGSTSNTQTTDFILDNDKIVKSDISYVPGLIKIINEIIDNCVDIAIKSGFKSGTKIDVTMNNEFIEVKDNGTGIPVIKGEDGIYLPELAWGHARAGSNFDDDENRTQIGMNGVGSFATNCFSTKFLGTTDDGKNRFNIEFTDNALNSTHKVSATHKRTGTSVKFYPDLEKFNITEIDETHLKVIKQRLMNLSMSYPEINFKFNGERINIGSFKKYAQMFSDDVLVYESDDGKYKFAIAPNPEDDFNHFTYLNGLKIPDGGSHIDTIVLQLMLGLRDKIQKKYKNIKPGDIKNKMTFIGFFTDFKNPKFNSQSKEKITNSTTEINQYLGKIDYEKMVNTLFRNKAFIDPITEVYRIKEEFKRRQELKGLAKTTKKIKSEKYMPATKNKKYLILAEGDCLDENQTVLMSDFNEKHIKDVEIGDTILSDTLEHETVLSKVKLLKKTVTITTKSSTITCGTKHRLKVYDTDEKTFKFVEAQIIKDNMKRYKLLKSKLDSQTHGLKIIAIDDLKILFENDELIYGTINDYFVVVRDMHVYRLHISELSVNDIIMMG